MDGTPKNSIWNLVEKKWPVPLKNTVTFPELQKQIGDFLVRHAVSITGLSHFGIVVKNIDQSLESLFDCIDKGACQVIKDWVPAYNVHVARLNLEGRELEFIEPEGKSFFQDFLNANGECLQHVSFQVTAIEKSLETLARYNVKLIDEKPRTGSHGKVAFMCIEQFAPLYLEVCQPSNIRK